MKESSRRRLPRADLYAVAAIVGIWVLMELLINPRGNFPLNDDWWYARTVRTLVSQHRLVFPYGVTMTLVAQVLWGSLFSSLFGFSFNALRLSTLVLGLTGILATYALLREVRASRPMAFIGAMAIAVNPIYMELSNTFMTDVPFYALAVLSVYLYVRGIRRGSKVEIILGTLMACVATLIRQVGVIFPVSFAAAYLIKNGVRPRSVATALVPGVLTAAILLGYEKWLSVSGNMSSFHGIQTQFAREFLHSGVQMIPAIADFAKKALVYLGLFLLPCLILTLPRKSEEESARNYLVGWLPSAVLFALLMGSLAYANQWMPLKNEPGNILMDFQLGPVVLFDVWVLQLPYIDRAPKVLWQIITVAGVAGSAFLFRHLLISLKGVLRKRKTESSTPRWLPVLLITACALYAIPILIISNFSYFDRYFLPMIPLLMAFACLSAPRQIKAGRGSIALAAVILVLFGYFAVAGTHDYFSWNRVRWKAYLDLVSVEKIPPREIQGGYECDGWFSYQEREDWHSLIGDTYLITLGMVDGYEALRQYPVKSWLPYGQEEILVLRRFE